MTASLSIEVPKNAVNSTETLMKKTKVTDRIEQITEDPNGIAENIVKAIERLTPDTPTQLQ